MYLSMLVCLFQFLSTAQLSVMASRELYTQPDAEMPLRLGESGLAAAEPRTVIQMFQETVERVGDRDAMAVKRDGEWVAWTFLEYYNDCCRAAKSFIKLGVKRFHSVGILGFNSPEWFIADIGAIFAGAFASGIYTTNGPQAVHYVVEHSRSQVVVVEDTKQLNKVLEVHLCF
eukprot:m.132320 g.132320  ORF g.132320 m.132320 type:complete len:173 (+) comp13933_c0_seq1:282-800(+)